MCYRPHYLQKTIHLFLLLAIAVAAARTFGQEGDAPAATEKFVPGGEGAFNGGATLELRPEVALVGEEVKLRQVCRWSDADKAAFDPLADLVLFRLSRQSPYRTLTVRELRDTLRDAGVNLAVVRLAGSTACTVARTDVKFDERTALDEWVAAKEAGATKPALIESPATKPVKDGAAEATPPVAPAAPKPALEEPANKTLRQYLVAEAAERLNLPADQLQLHFAPGDAKLLNLAEPHFSFNVKSPRSKNLGETTWDVSIVAGDAAQKASITGTVRAWQNQLVVNKPLGYRQVFREADLIDRRSLVDQLSDDPLVTRDQVVGQMVGRDLKSGTILTARLIEPTLLVKSGQLVSVALTQGGINVKSVARATEQGSMGQTIRVRNEVTGNTFDVIITGPQTARLLATGPTDRPDVAALDR